VTTPIHAQSCFERGFNVMFGSDDNPQWQTHEGLFRADYLWQIGKVGIDSPAGWIAFVRGSREVAFVEQFTVFAGEEYPDGGATVECWTVGAGKVANLDYAESGIYLMETEVLSPFHTIAPGAEAHFDLTWSVCQCNGPVIDANEAGCTSRQLTAHHTPDGVLLEGSFGVFDEGVLYLRWGTGANSVLGIVSPMSVVRLQQVVSNPRDVSKIELVVRGKADEIERLLAVAEISPQPAAP
jgi:hypothetical protein